MRAKSRDKAPKCDDIFCMVNGKPSNASLCEQMLEGEKDSPEVTAFMINLAKSMGFSDEEAQLYWG